MATSYYFRNREQRVAYVTNWRLTTPRGRYHMYKDNARRRKIEFGISYDEFKTFWKKPCSYCGTPVRTIGVDRKDSAKGYSVDNVVPCCGPCNRTKVNQTEEAFLAKRTGSKWVIVNGCRLFMHKKRGKK